MAHEWHPISDYEGDPEELANKELPALSSVWNEQKAGLSESQGIQRFTERLKREWAIETGLIERLYTLDRGVTELMIEHGIKAGYISHRTAGDPRHTVAMIYDQQEVIEDLFTFAREERSLTTNYIKEQHGLFTRHQEYTEGRDRFGRDVQVKLVRGDYKQWPNNPTRPDGAIHEYCPPEQTASEMDRLIEMHLGHEDIAPEVEAAWLHHRFTQIHPFQDGNGRVARALATLVFIKAGWLPLVVRDDDRERYIAALEKADGGDLAPLVWFFSELQKKAFINVIGIDREVEQTLSLDARIEWIVERLRQRENAPGWKLKTTIENADHLHQLAQRRMDEVCSNLGQQPNLKRFDFFVHDAINSGERSHYHKRQIISTARELDYYANTGIYRSWVRIGMKDRAEGSILISFHGTGHEFRGVLVCTGTWFERILTEDGYSESTDENRLCDEVFQINYREEIRDIEIRFQAWLERVLVRGLALWKSTAF